MTTKLCRAARQIIVDWDSGVHLHEAVTVLRETLAEQECESCEQVVKSGTYVNNNSALTKESTTGVCSSIAQQPDESPSYGIIDPDYARIYTKARCLAWQEGYALAMHGSFTRDLDLIAVPWTEQACAPEKLAARIADACGLRINGAPGKKPHERLAFTFLFNGFGDPRFIDLSVIARAVTIIKE